MATKKFIIEVEEGVTEGCAICPCETTQGCYNLLEKYGLYCSHYNLATMKIKEMED